MRKYKYFRSSDLIYSLNNIRTQSVLRGEWVGFPGLDEIYTMKKGYPLVVAGAPHSGKTEFVLELLVSMSEMYGWKHFVYLGETGSAAEIVAELCHKHMKKPYRSYKDHKVPNEYAMTDDEVTYAQYWVEEHFVILDLEAANSLVTSFKIDEFYKLVEEAEDEYGIKFNTTLIDPWNDVEDQLKEFGREDKFISHALRVARISSKQNNRVDIIINHIADISPITDKASGKRYTPIALPTEWAGGRAWHRRAFTMLLIYRPPTYLNDENGEPYADNETFIINQKAKPKGSGKLGQRSLFWDWKKSRFYEKIPGYGNNRRYAQEKKESALKLISTSKPTEPSPDLDDVKLPDPSEFDPNKKYNADGSPTDGKKEF